MDDVVAGDYAVPRNFVPTAPSVNPSDDPETWRAATTMAINPQTVEFCKRFGVTDPMAKLSSVLRREAEAEAEAGAEGTAGEQRVRL